MNFAARYAKEIDERFTRASQAMLALNNNYTFTGVKTVNVYSIPTVPMTDYNRAGELYGSSGGSRYGAVTNLQNNIQALTVTKDRSFTFAIDKGDKLQTEMVMDAGRALSRETLEVWVPEYDSYVFRKLAAEAQARGNYVATAATKSNAYELFLAGMESLGNKNVPDQGRVCFCSYGFANLLKQDPAFMRYGDKSQEMLIKGVIGEVDGCKIVKVPATRLPAGAAFLLTHPIAATAPKQLEEFRIHDDPPGISGWLVEGRVIYDCFVLNEKADAIYYCGGQSILQPINVYTAPTPGTNKSVVITDPGVAQTGHKFVYKTDTTAATVAYGDALTTGWTDLPANHIVTVSTASHVVISVAEVDTTASKAVAFGSAAINKTT